MTEIAHALARAAATPRFGQPSPLATANAALVRLFDTLLTWNARARERRQLLSLNGRLLADIGVDRAAAQQEAEKPFWRA